MLHVQRSTEGPQSGLFKEANFGHGEKMAPCYGYKGIVRLPRPPYLSFSLILLNFAAGVGKSVLWYALFRIL